ncbi:MAG: carbohydrate binding domain-containing protein [Verrucomicrobiota bacterium]|jgi:hypothetical protein
MKIQIKLFRWIPFLPCNVLAAGALWWTAVAGAAELTQDGGFESGSVSSWTTNGVELTGSPTHTGAYAVQITLYPGPSAFVSQQVSSQMIAGESYTFSAWVYLSDTTFPPMPAYGPRIRISSSADLHDALTNGEQAARDLPAPVIGWNLLQVTRVFSEEELGAQVYFGGIRVGGPGNYVFDDFSVIGPAATPSAPSLFIEQTATNSLLLAWTNAPGFVLQENPDLQSGNWTTNTATPVITGAVKQVTVQVLPGARFYRLISN